jgi:HK97 gp10 family phage protein
MEVTVRIDGLRELNEALKQLPREVSEKLLDTAVGRGASVVRDEARRRAPIAVDAHFRARGRKTPPGVLRKAVLRARAREVATFFSRTWVVGVRHGKRFQKKDQDAFYWWWVENGHKIVPRHGRAGGTLRSRRVGSHGRVPAYPFLRPAFDARKFDAVEAMRRYLADTIPKAAERLRRR